MEEQVMEYILSGNTDEKQFLIGNKVITVNPKKTQEQIEKEIEDEYQSVMNEKNYMKFFLIILVKKMVYQLILSCYLSDIF